tara:strand:- start:220 stop:726 length:507 start_codon:yes stop_codon:yes gene_type:complete
VVLEESDLDLYHWTDHRPLGTTARILTMSDTVTDNNRITRNIDKSIKQKEQLEGYEQRHDPDHPYCTNWPTNKKMDRFDLEEQIQTVWQTKQDLDAVTERIMEDTVFMSRDQISNVLIGISELHETRMWKLWQIFETMVRQKNSFLTDEITMGDVLDKIVDDAGEDDE